jgi:hypothetical protein
VLRRSNRNGKRAGHEPIVRQARQSPNRP